MAENLLTRKQTHFVLWRPSDLVAHEPVVPALFIGSRPQDNFDDFRELPLARSEEFPEVWEIAATDCGLTDGQVYYYWFKVNNNSVYANGPELLYCTDPLAWTIDRRFPAPRPPEESGILSLDPASVVLYQTGKLVPCDPAGQQVDWTGDTPVGERSPNNRLVIYELPTRWARLNNTGELEVGSGTFQDVLALLLTTSDAPNFPLVAGLKDRAHLIELGINALELLPVADSSDTLNWGYGTANYLAADFDLGFPSGQEAPTASTDLATLIKVCHQQGLRVIVDMVMAFSRDNPYNNIDFLSFYIRWNSGDPEQGGRDGFGGDLFKYNYWLEGYHPLSGRKEWLVPAREFLKTYLAHWMTYYRLDGLRLDSVNNIANFDFVGQFKDYARYLWRERGGSDDRFMVVGEDLGVPLAWVEQGRLDGLWNEKFKQIVRQIVLGHSWSDEPSFEWSVRKLIDCRNLGFADGANAVNYLTSHDVGGMGNERIYNWLVNNGVSETEQRIKLAFVCLLTAVGIPMILAGDEFADKQDEGFGGNPDQYKQIDPVNFSRLNDDWRQRIFSYVARLVHLRTTSPALAVNDTQFIQADFGEGKRVLAWQRGSGEHLVVVVANFSDYGTPDPLNPAAEYRIPGWPAAPAGKNWREVTQDRSVPLEWAGREPVYPWEAKVYVLE